MLKREERQRKVAEWLEHLQGWRASGESLAAYAQRSGLALWAAYHWRKVLTQEGSWPEDTAVPGKSRPVRKGAGRVPLRFARVTVTESARSAPLMVRIQLANGRRAEIELGDAGQLDAVLGVLERPA